MGTWQQIIMGLGVNLIASSIVYAVGYKNPAIILFALGLPLIALVAIFSRKPKPLAVDDNRTGGVSSNSSTTNQDSFRQSRDNVGNPTQTQNASPTAQAEAKVEQHFYYPPPASHAPPVAARKPNIEFGEIKEYQIYLNPESNKFYMGAKAQNFTRAILIQVINGAGSGTREVTVKAAARFTQEGKRTTVSPMTWIGEYFNEVTLAPLEQKYLILGVMQRGLTSLETGKPETIWITPRNNRSSSQTPSADNLQLSFLGGIKGPQPVTVTVELVSYNGDLLQRKRFLWKWTLLGVEVTPLE
jgi:hypothetical protein